MIGKHSIAILAIATLAMSFVIIPLDAVEGDVTISTSDQYNGYTLYGDSRNAYLIDMDGETVNTWSFSDSGGYSYYLTEDGGVIRPAEVRTSSFRGGASGGIVQKLDWDGNLVWDFEYSSSDYLPHHDIEPLPNGNVLLIVWEVKSVAEATSAGITTTNEIWPDYIVEIEPDGMNGGNVVWEWHVWDHLIQDTNPLADNYGVVEDHPELLDGNVEVSSADPNSDKSDWMHMNSVSYNEELDLIAFTSHFFNEVYIIDHSTTTEEAASHSGGNYGMGGDFLYRWGNPSNYGASGETYFSTVHYCNWVDEGSPGEGNILAFNNNEEGRASEVVEISPTTDSSGNFVIPADGSSMYGDQEWVYSEGTSMYSAHQGSNQRLPNGNTLIATNSDKRIIEVTPSGDTAWSFSTSSDVKMSLRYSLDYPGLASLGSSCEITYPEDGDVLSGTVEIAGVISSSGVFSSVDLIQVSFDNSGIWNDVEGDSEWTYEWDTTQYSDGTHTISALAISSGIASSSFDIDVVTSNGFENEMPQCSITSPMDDSTESGDITIQGTSSDPDGTVQLVQVSIGGEDTWDDADGTTSWSYDLDTTAIDNGYLEIYARSYDGVEFSDPDMTSIQVENEEKYYLPTCTVTSLVDGQEVSGTITISGSASDSDGSVDEVQVSTDGQNWDDADGTTSWSYTLDTTTLSDGHNMIYVRSIDNTGRVSENAVIELDMNNGSNEENNLVLILVVVSILALLVIIGIIFYMRRRNAEDDQADEGQVYYDHILEASVISDENNVN